MTLVRLTGLVSKWYRGTMASGQLSQLRTINFFPFVNAVPSRSFGDLVSVWIQQDREIPNTDLTQNVRRIVGGFALDRMQGRPIVVAETLDGPYFLVEGYTRCSVLLLKHYDGSLRDVDVPVLIGLAPQLRRWSWVTLIEHSL